MGRSGCHSRAEKEDLAFGDGVIVVVRASSIIVVPPAERRAAIEALCFTCSF